MNADPGQMTPLAVVVIVAAVVVIVGLTAWILYDVNHHRQTQLQGPAL